MKLTKFIFGYYKRNKFANRVIKMLFVLNQKSSAEEGASSTEYFILYYCYHPVN